jgi:scyllo-inositol 2-dehydrogenase (NADP+)
VAARPIRTAILGFGVSGRVFHSPFIAAHPDYSLDFITTANPDRAAQARAVYPDATILAAPEDVFAHADQLDLVVIGTPPATHYSLAERAINAGLNVVVDKPFVPTSAEGEVLITKAAEAGVVLTVFQNRRWDADFLTLQKLLREGRLGEPRSFESRFEWWKPEGMRDWKAETDIAYAGGILFDLGPHLIDQAIQLFGPVSEVYGETARHTAAPRSDADDDAFVSLLHTSGVRSRLWMNGTAALPAPRFHVLGSAAAYTKWGLDRQEPELIAGALPSDPDYGLESEEHWGMLGVPGHSERVPAELGAYPEFYRLLAECLAGDGPAPVDPADSVVVTRIIEEVHARSRA